MNELNEYRCTRPDLYGRDTPGYLDLWCRQGYHVVAGSVTEAHLIMLARFPGESFDVRVFRRNVAICETGLISP